MTYNVHFETFKSALAQLHAADIHTLDALKAPEQEALFVHFWTAAENFINHFALCSKTHRKADGTLSEGNADRLKALAARGVDVEDVRSDILLHMFTKLDKILSKSLAHQPFYAYTLVNNCVCDAFRKLPPISEAPLSLEETIHSGNHRDDDSRRLQDTIADPSTLEDNVMARETARLRLQQRRTILRHELAALTSKPEQMFIHLCSDHLGMTPAEITDLIFEQGLTEAVHTVIDLVASENYNVSSMLHSALDPKNLKLKTLKLDTCDPAAISAQFSRLSYRADQSLQKGARSPKR